MVKPAVDVARRCICLELLLQRYVLENDDEAPLADRDLGRSMWLARVGDLGVTENLFRDERALLERPVGELTDDDLDDLHGRSAGASVLAWALGRAKVRPTFATFEALVAEHGLLGDGSIPLARAAAESGALRSEAELDEGLASYLRLRGKAREIDDPERIFAGLAAHHLTWILEETMPFDHDIELG